LIICVWSLASCGGGSSSVTPPLLISIQVQQGNWVFEGVSSTGVITPLHLGASITQSGSNVSIAFVPLGPCLPVGPPTLTQASVTATGMTAKAAFGDATLDINLAGNSTQMFGTYSVTGGCANGDHGSLTATYVPPVTGTWTGAIQNIFGTSPDEQVTLTLTQSNASVFGFYPITGTIQVTGSACITTATVGPGSPLAGNPAIPSTITGTTMTLYLTSGTTTTTAMATLVPPGYDKQVHFLVSGSTFDNGSVCPDFMGTGILLKQ